MKILVIDEEFPYPLNTGKRIRTFSLTKELTRHDEVSYLAFGRTDSEAANQLSAQGITCHAVPSPDRTKSGPLFYLRLLANLFSPDPYIVTSHFTRDFEAKLIALVNEQQYDIIICEWTPYASYLRSVKNSRSIIVAHNIESAIWRRYYENEKNPLKRWYIGRQLAKIEKFEANCFGWSSGATTVSQLEADTLTSLDLPYRVQVVENGVDLGFFKPDNEAVDPHQLVFTGSMDWRPNQDAMEFFVRDIFPLVKRLRPELKIDVVGRRPPEHIQALGDVEGVRITGTVDDVRPYIARAALYLVPLRIGGGSRLKILEAMAMQKPVLSTTVGAEGLDVTPGQDIVIADGPEAFAKQIIACLDQTESMRELARAGHVLVRGAYGWAVLGNKLRDYLKELAGDQ